MSLQSLSMATPELLKLLEPLMGPSQGPLQGRCRCAVDQAVVGADNESQKDPCYTDGAGF